MILKIGRYVYNIKENDLFLDNGACVMLMSQSKESPSMWSKISPKPTLSKKAIKQILPFKKIVKTEGCLTYFKLQNMEQTK